jgi:hypothetical protein
VAAGGLPVSGRSGGSSSDGMQRAKTALAVRQAGDDEKRWESNKSRSSPV